MPGSRNILVIAAAAHRRAAMRLAVAATLVAVTTSALAADRQATSTLPGVKGDYRIVRPAPEPGGDTSGDGETMRIGDWDVTVSGSITIDVSAGSLPAPRDHAAPASNRSK